MKKYTFYTNKKIVFMLLAVLILNIVQVMLNINIELFFFLTNLILFSIVMISIISVLLYNTVLKISLDDISITKGFIFKKNIYWNTITAIQRREEHFIIYEGLKRTVINLNILKNSPNKYRDFFSLMAKYLYDSTEIDNESQKLLDGDEIITKIESPLYKIGGWLLVLYIFIIAYLIINVLSMPLRVMMMSFEEYAVISVLQLIGTLVIVIVSITTIIHFTKKNSETIEHLKTYLWVFSGHTILTNFTSRFFEFQLQDNITNMSGFALSIIGSILMMLAVNEYINTSIRVKNTFYTSECGVANSKKRITILFFGKVDSENTTNWYNEIKQQLQIDNIKISKIMASPDKLLDGYSKYYDLESREQVYLESITNKASEIELCELGFSCGDNNTSTPCYGDMSWGKQIYKEGMSLSFSYSAAQNVTIEKYIDIYKKYIDWHWIHMYEIDHMYEVSVKRVKGHMVEHGRSKSVLNDWKR